MAIENHNATMLIRRLNACEGLLGTAMTDIRKKRETSYALRDSSKIARALDDIEAAQSAIASIALDIGSVVKRKRTPQSKSLGK